MKIIPEIKVSEIPFFEGNISRADKEKYGMIMANGDVNYYRVQMAKGFGGSRKEETWNKALHQHTCCKSKVPWRHKIACPRLKI